MTSFADHHVRGLDDRPGVVAFLEIEIGHGLVGDRGRDDDATADVDADMGRRGALRHIDDLSLQLIARAELHGAFLHVAIGYGTIPRTAHAVAANDRSPS